MNPLWIREAQVDDAAAIAGIHISAWQAAYAHVLPAAYLERLGQQLAAREARWRQALAAEQLVLVAQHGPQVVGWIAAGPSRDADAHALVGEVEAIYLAPTHWRCGIGTPLMQAALAKLLRRGYTETTLWVLEGNTRAAAFYQHLGFSHQPQHDRCLAIAGQALTEQRLWRTNKSPLPAR